MVLPRNGAQFAFVLVNLRQRVGVLALQMFNVFEKLRVERVQLPPQFFIFCTE
jgi:hypothetical protein